MSELHFEACIMPGADLGPQNPLPHLGRSGRAGSYDPARVSYARTSGFQDVGRMIRDRR